jgi:hypothetical protein
MRLLNRREFNGLCVALGSCVASSDASAVGLASGEASSGASRTVKFPTGTVVPALGQGSWHLGQGRHPAAEEEEALRTGRPISSRCRARFSFRCHSASQAAAPNSQRCLGRTDVSRYSAHTYRDNMRVEVFRDRKNRGGPSHGY